MGALKARKAERKLNDIVYIDTDGDRFDNAIIIDDDEYGSKSSYSNLQCVICVDDDDNDDAGCRQTSVYNVGDLDSDASSGRRSFLTSNSKLRTIDIDGDGSPSMNGKKFAFKLARCKQKSFGKVPARNCYGWSFNTYTGLSEIDCSDCEVIDSSCGKLQEQWKRDSQKRRTRVPMEAKGSSDAKNIAVAEIREAIPCVSSIINEREKLKASHEYKAAVEEEWASRKRELQIQAEESQRLRKRKKAETLRLLDMQRRQKERVEEVRETKKKDEENMNLKEKIRAEMVESLSKLEVACIDMASLLQALGIEVGRSLVPESEEVHAAYRRALLKFHPDRASRMDVRQQVEAEEKFKLISRMKEKLQQ